MTATEIIEQDRLELQSVLDSLKSANERNRLGQFATPPPLASELLQLAKGLLPSQKTIKFMDPAFGTGSFYSALLRAFSKSQISRSLGFEIDPHYGVRALELWDSQKLELKIEDFTKAEPPLRETKKPNLVICNPPYVRHHHLGSEDKARLHQQTLAATGIETSGLTGLYCYFLLLTHQWLAKNALSIWLIPSEFMDVNYGAKVKDYLTRHVTLDRIHRFDPNAVQFDDALVSSAVVIFRNTSPSENHKIRFTYGGTLANPKRSKQIQIDESRAELKWTRYPINWRRKEKSDKRTLSDIFTIKRGIATGANSFFILTKDQVEENEIPDEFLTPILPSPRYLAETEVAKDRIGNPRVAKKLFVLSSELDEETLRRDHASLWNYLLKGIGDRVHEGYLCKHRNLWYCQEKRLAPPLLCTYMGRGEKKRPFRFILNHSRAIATNVYLLLYPKPHLAEAIKADPCLTRRIWVSLNNIPSETLLGEGRVYGGGLHKLEPRELANTPVDSLLLTDPKLLANLSSDS